MCLYNVTHIEDTSIRNRSSLIYRKIIKNCRAGGGS